MLDNFDAVAKLIEMNKQFRKIIKELVANGFNIKQTQKGFRIAPQRAARISVYTSRMEARLVSIRYAATS